MSLEEIEKGCYYKITFPSSGNFYTAQATSNESAIVLSKNGGLYAPGSKPSLYFQHYQIIEKISMEEATLAFTPKSNKEAVKMLSKEE